MHGRRIDERMADESPILSAPLIRAHSGAKNKNKLNIVHNTTLFPDLNFWVIGEKIIIRFNNIDYFDFKKSALILQKAVSTPHKF